MATGTIKNPKNILDTANSVRFQLMTQSGWTIGQSVIFRNAKPTVVSGTVVGERNLTAAEISAFNSEMNWVNVNHMFHYYTTNSAIANLSGKTILLNFA